MRVGTEELLKSYLTEHITWGTRSTMEQCQPICDFVGVGQSSVRRWYNGVISPKGMSLIKVRYFLKKNGYLVHDLEKLEPSVYTLGYLIAYGFLEYDEVKKFLGYSDESSLMRILHGWFCPLPQKVAEIEKICALYLDKITDRKITTIVTGNLVTEKVDRRHFDELIKDVIHQLGTLKHVLIPLEEKLGSLISDNYTPEQRQQFRKIAGEEIVFELSNAFYRFNEVFNASCSEQARKNYLKEKK